MSLRAMSNRQLTQAGGDIFEPHRSKHDPVNQARKKSDITWLRLTVALNPIIPMKILRVHYTQLNEASVRSKNVRKKKERETKEVRRSASGLEILFTVGPFFRSLYLRTPANSSCAKICDCRAIHTKVEQISSKSIFFSFWNSQRKLKKN